MFPVSSHPKPQHHNLFHPYQGSVMQYPQIIARTKLQRSRSSRAKSSTFKRSMHTLQLLWDNASFSDQHLSLYIPLRVTCNYRVHRLPGTDVHTTCNRRSVHFRHAPQCSATRRKECVVVTIARMRFRQTQKRRMEERTMLRADALQKRKQITRTTQSAP